jgi:hypothetical protein
MKQDRNIHILPTDKPSRLHLESNGLKLSRLQYTLVTQHIYITSDEALPYDNSIFDSGAFYHRDPLGDVHIITKHTFKPNPHFCRRIILTTDQDLIKDGVQEIPDEFLEWFVKNPSCKSVEVKYSYPTIDDEGDGSISEGYWLLIIPEENKIYRECPNGCRGKLSYLISNNECLCSCGTKWNIETNKIIIPKEEPKQVCVQCDGNGETVFSGTYSSQKKCDVCNGRGYVSSETIKQAEEDLNLIKSLQEPIQETELDAYYRNGIGGAKQETTLEELAERLKGKELFKESNDRARETLSEIKSSEQETLEEYIKNYNELPNGGFKTYVGGYIDGAKWQAERMYSEEEVMEMFHNLSMHLPLHYEFLVKEQFKKK